MIANDRIFGGGQYSVAGGMQLRTVGRRKWPISGINIKQAKGGQRAPGGRYMAAWVDPFMPGSMKDEFHPGGNSICYAVQVCHLMGCNPIYLLGFTLQSGAGYEFGADNPITRRRSIYDAERAIHWLKWYESQYPGRAKLWPGWSGPVYDALQVVSHEEAEALSRNEQRHEPDAHSADGEEVERLRPDHEGKPLHEDGE